MASEPQTLGEIRVAARADQLQRVRQRLAELVADQFDRPADAQCVVLAVNEACMNVIQHGYGGADVGDIIVRVQRADNELVVHVLDFAAPVESSAVRSRDLEDIRPGGLGVHLIREVMDSMQFLSPPPGFGNLLELRKRLSPPKSPT